MYKEALEKYKNGLDEQLNKIDSIAFQGFIELLQEAYKENRQVFIMGNGGSAGTANHFTCDFGKNAVLTPGKRRFRILSLSDNVEKITALGNDFDFTQIFRQQLINLMQEGDLVIAVSASGNSPNIVTACEYIKERRGKIIGLSGFDGGKLKDLADISMVADANTYEQIEDIHLILLHMVICFLKEHPEVLD